MKITATKTYNDLNAFKASPEAQKYDADVEIVDEYDEYIAGSLYKEGKCVGGVTIAADDGYTDTQALEVFLEHLAQAPQPFDVATLILYRKGDPVRLLIFEK